MRTMINQAAAEFLNNYSIPALSFKRISESQLRSLKYPAILKSNSLNNPIRAKVHTFDQAEKEFHRLRLYGEVLSQSVVKGFNLRIRVDRDPAKRPVILLSFMGLHDDIINREDIQVCPISKKTARQMVNNLSLEKYIEKKHFQQLADCLYNLSKLAVRENAKEIHIEPFTITRDSGVVVDSRLLLG